MIVGLAALWLFAGDKTPTQKDRRQEYLKAEKAGNFRDAYDGLRQLALDPADDSAEVGNDLTHAISCLQQLGREDEIDDFREGVIAAHKDNWRLLDTAAKTLQDNQHFGYIVAGKFYRGHRRGGGRYVNAFDRDRVRALQLMQQAQPLVKQEKDRSAVASYHFHFADVILHGAGFYEAWCLQSLTDLTQLPDSTTVGATAAAVAALRSMPTASRSITRCPRATRRRRTTASAGAGCWPRPLSSSRPASTRPT